MPTDAETTRADPRLRDEDLRRAFAREWLRRPLEPFSCAIEQFPSPADCNVAALAASMWQTDEFVIAEMRRLSDAVASGLASLVPTRDQAAMIAFAIAQDAKKPTSERLNALRLGSDIVGYTGPKSVAAVSPVTLNVNKVMKVVDKGGEKSWTEAAIAQQRGLVAEARA